MQNNGSIFARNAAISSAARGLPDRSTRTRSELIQLRQSQTRVVARSAHPAAAQRNGSDSTRTRVVISTGSSIPDNRCERTAQATGRKVPAIPARTGAACTPVIETGVAAVGDDVPVRAE